MQQEAWYREWQSPEHAVSFDIRAGLDLRNLIRNFESFNDVRLLNERLQARRSTTLLEIGCATGEFSRYMHARHPLVRYVGADISRPAIERAREKYPNDKFVVTKPEMTLPETVEKVGMLAQPDLIYSKDVVHHQVHPYELLEEMIAAATEMVVIRTRTRDHGTTELDVERSCQYHYGGWMPFLVFNIDELIARIRKVSPESEVVAYRHHMTLGGKHNRFVPKELYLKETGCAETAVGIFKRSSQPGRVVIEDRPDERPVYTLQYRLRHALRQSLDALTPQSPSNGHG